MKKAGVPASPTVILNDDMTREEQEMEITAALMREGMLASQAEKKAKKVLDLLDEAERKGVPISNWGEA